MTIRFSNFRLIKILKMNLFTDLIAALKEATHSLKDLAGLTKKEREKYRDNFQEAYILLNTTLGMVISKLGDARDEERKEEFNRKVKSLDNFEEWFDAERKIGLCGNLRNLRREMDTILGRITGLLSVKSWKKLQAIMDKIFANETDLARYISTQLKDVAGTGQKKIPQKKILHKIIEFRDQLLNERQMLLEQERELMSII